MLIHIDASPKQIFKKSNFITFFFCMALCVMALSLHSSKVLAITGADFQPGRIIDDAVFTDNSVMSVQDIQNFLNAKVGTCDTYGTQPSTHWDSAANRYYTHAEWGSSHGNPPPYTCINEYFENTSTLQNNFSSPTSPVSGGISAAWIIYNAAQEYNISPEVILATLQKEQGLVTDNWPWYDEFQYAMGYSCPDTSGCSGSYADFYKQVDGAAWQFRQYLNNPTNYNYLGGVNNNILYNPNAACGRETVFIQNQATAALYDYTPYVPDQAALNSLTGTGDSCSAYGNRNFWYYFNTWFGSSISLGLPADATLYVSSPSGKIYLVLNDDGVTSSYYIPSWDYLTAYNLAGGIILHTTDDFIATLGTSSTMSNVYSINGAIYLADQGRSFHVSTYQECVDWALSCSIAPDLTNNIAFTSWLQNNGELPPEMINNGVAYKVTNGQKQPFGRVSDIFNAGYNWSNFVTVQNLNATETLGPVILTSPALVNFAPSGQIYFFDGTNYHRITDYNTMIAWGFDKQPVLAPPSSSYNNTPPSVGADLGVWQTDGTNDYLMDNGAKLNYTNQVSQWPSESLQSFAASYLPAVPTINVSNAVAANGAVYIVQGGALRHIETYNDLLQLGVNIPTVTPLSSAAAGYFTQGSPIFPDGVTYSLNGGPKIYVTSDNGSLWVTTGNIFNGYGLNWGGIRSLSSSDVTGYAASGSLTSLAKSSEGQTYFVDSGQKYTITSADLSAWSASSSSFSTVSDSILQGLPTQNLTSLLYNSDDGRIYYITGGQKYYVTTYASYLNLGGYANTTTVNTSLINLIPSAGSDPY